MTHHDLTDPVCLQDEIEWMLGFPNEIFISLAINVRTK
jgi:hypothetical protein